MSPRAVATHGCLSDGRNFAYTLPPPGAGACDVIGRMTTDDFLVKARVTDDSDDAALYLLTRTHNRDEEKRA